MNYRKLCRRLIAELRETRESAARTAAFYEERAIARARAAQEDADYYYAEAQRRAYEDGLRSDALERLESARKYGDTWREEKALRDLRRYC